MTFEIGFLFEPEHEPGRSLGARVCDWMNFYIDNVNPKNNAIQLNAATLLARSFHHTTATQTLLKKGDLLSAYTLMRSNLETSYCLGALSEDAETAMNVMKKTYLREQQKVLNNLIVNGHRTFSNGSNIQDQIELIEKHLQDFDDVQSGIFKLVQIADSDYITYRFLSPYAHPHSMICAAQYQFGPNDLGPTVRIGYKDEINSEHFLINAAIGFDCLWYSLKLFDVAPEEKLEALESDIQTAYESDEQATR